MKKIFDFAFCFLVLFQFMSCSNKPEDYSSEILTDSVSIANGRTKFIQNCSSCHNFTVDGIGPHLGGLTKDQSPAWIKEFIKDSKAKIDGGDKRAVELFNTFKTAMPPFGFLSEDDLNAIIAFIHTHEAPDSRKSRKDPNALSDPIPGSIPMTDIVVELSEFTQIPASGESNPRTRITKLTTQPNTNKLFVVDLRGKLYFLNGNKPEVYMDMTKEKSSFIHTPGLATGFGSYAFHPEFARNGLLYTTHTEPASTAKADFGYADSIKVTLQWVLTEWKTKTPGAKPFVGESREMMRIDMVSQIHGVQEIAFNPLAKPGDADYGLLYMGIGDGGSAENGYPFLCTGNETIWASVIRIDPKGNNSKNGKYGIPESNPFAKSDNDKIVKEIFAYGFRNPHRIIWDRSGRILIPNIGHHNIESLYLIEAGSNSGWPLREGTFVIDPSQNMWNIYPRPTDDAKNNYNYPIAEYDHDEGNAIAGGFEYDGKLLPELKGKFVFGDIVRGRMFYIDMNDIKPGTQAQIKEWRISFNGEITTLSKLCDSQKVDERFGMDNTGELYLTTKPDGKIYRLVSSRKQ
jgi:mono/diheme cytochrome c family protein